MELPISKDGNTTVNELIAALLQFPPNAVISMTSNFCQDTTLEVSYHGVDTIIMEGVD